MSVVSLATARISQPLRRALRSDFLRHSALVFGASMASNVLNYVFNFALSRRLGVEGFATLSSLVSFLMILSIPMTVLSLIVVKYTAVYHAANDSARVRRLSQVVLKWTSLCGVVIFCAGALLLHPIASFLHIDDAPAILLCLGIVAVSVATPSARSILQGEQDFIRYSVSLTLETLLKVLLGVAFVYAGLGVAGAMLGWIIGTSLSLAYTVWAVFRKHGTPTTPVALGIDLRRLVTTTAGVGIALGALTILSFMDVLLVKHYFSARVAGLYAAVNLTGKIVFFIVGFVPAVVLPKAIAKSSSGENPVPLLVQSAALTAIMSGAVLLAFSVFPHVIVSVLAGKAFAAAAPYVLQYDSAMCLLALLALLVNYRIGVHRFEFLYGLCAVLIGEIAGIAIFHSSIWEIIHILLIGNAIGIGVCAWRLNATPSALAQSEAA